MEAKIDNFIDTVDDVTKTIMAATNNVNPKSQEEQQLRDPTKKCSKGQSSKRIKGPLETKLRKKKSIHIIPEYPLSYGRTMSEVYINFILTKKSRISFSIICIYF